MKKTFIISLFVSVVLLMLSCSATTKIEYAVAAASADCPMDLGDGLTITDIDTEDNNVVYTCVCDESETEFDVSDLDEPYIRAIMKDAITSELKNDPDKDIQDLLQMCKDANYNIVYRFVGSYTGSQIDIILYSYEM